MFSKVKIILFRSTGFQNIRFAEGISGKCSFLLFNFSKDLNYGKVLNAGHRPSPKRFAGRF